VRGAPTGERSRAGVQPRRGLFEQGVRVQHDREIAQAVSVAELAQPSSGGRGSSRARTSRSTSSRAGGFLPAATTDPAQYPPAGTQYGEYIDGHTRAGRWWSTSQRCIGCSACVVACYAENNIPVVGPDEVKRGRELHWLRIERYWGSAAPGGGVTDDATDDTRFLPMLCQHCGNAPCEPVCPVYAAYHTPDGLNGQVYNRCVGTRYCANNCPWKVRYFNWFTYEFAEPLNWQLNPDVTVREKGVMEKCTFCVQRIREGAPRGAGGPRGARRRGRAGLRADLPDRGVRLRQHRGPDSAVSQAARSVRSYRTLEEINVQPAIVYLRRSRWTSPRRAGHHAAAPARDTAH
jgi:Fe-S-cluster-containing dehydrogenase component